MRVVPVGALPESALEAAAEFHVTWVPRILTELGLLYAPRPQEDVALIFAPAPHDHHGWRLAAIQNLAREAVPSRVNGIVGDDEGAIAELIAYLELAPGVTGQLLAV